MDAFLLYEEVKGFLDKEPFNNILTNVPEGALVIISKKGGLFEISFSIGLSGKFHEPMFVDIIRFENWSLVKAQYSKEVIEKLSTIS